MKAMIKRLCQWIADLILADIKKPLTDIQNTVDAIQKKVEKLEDESHRGKVFDLAVGEDRIIWLINKAIERGYRTADDRRIIPNLYDAYKARGGNHGADAAYQDFCKLPTEEEYTRERKEEKA